MTNITEPNEVKLKDLKQKTPAELVTTAEELQVENASALRKQELMFGILKKPKSSARASSKSCRTASASCARRTLTTSRGRTTSM
jgi:transcription termination factor Rho